MLYINKRSTVGCWVYPYDKDADNNLFTKTIFICLSHAERSIGQLQNLKCLLDYPYRLIRALIPIVVPVNFHASVLNACVPNEHFPPKYEVRVDR